MQTSRKRKKTQTHITVWGFAKLEPPSILGPPQTLEMFNVRPLGCPRIFTVRNVVHLEMLGKTPNINKILSHTPRGGPQEFALHFLRL